MTIADSLREEPVGFRTTFITQQAGGIVLPEWFVEKWQDAVHFSGGNRLPMSSKYGMKSGYWTSLEEDLQKVLPDERSRLVIVYLHECGGVTRTEIAQAQVRYVEPRTWEQVPLPSHQNCWGCSDIDYLQEHGWVSADTQSMVR